MQWLADNLPRRAVRSTMRLDRPAAMAALKAEGRRILTNTERVNR
jgi:hypothetical protein